MKRFSKCIRIMALSIGMALGLVGCTDVDNMSAEPVNIAFVGIADDESKIDKDIEELKELAMLPGSDYTFISIEGKPAVIDAGTIPDLSDRGYSKAMLKRVYDGIREELIFELDSYEPTTSEIDIATATEIAVRSLLSKRQEGRENILVYYCGGKSTTGIINMIDNPIYMMDAETSAQSVAEKMHIEMSGIKVIWYCCGFYHGVKQDALSSEEMYQMRTFYENLFISLGAESVEFNDNYSDLGCYSFRNTPVSCMEVEEVESVLRDKEVLSPTIFEEPETVFEGPIVIPEEKVHFQPDSSEYLDPEAAVKAIQPVADYLMKYSELEILCYGTCAGEGESPSALALGKDRADKVKETLVAAGIDSSRITTVAISPKDDPYYSFNLGTGEEAIVNRKCVLLDITSELARNILRQSR